MDNENVYVIVGCFAKHCRGGFYSNVTIYAPDNFFITEEEAIRQLKLEMNKDLADARGGRSETGYELFAVNENAECLTWDDNCRIKSGKIDDVPIIPEADGRAKYVRFGYKHKEETTGMVYTYYVNKCPKASENIRGINS